MASDDDFWDISSLLPKIKSAELRVEKAGSFAEITLGGDESRGDTPIPPRKSVKIEIKEENDAPITREYDGGALRRVKISPWPTKFTFYSRFASQAEKLWRKKGKEAPQKEFFSYMPQYDYMTRDQLAFYLYFRDRARHGEYLPVGVSYILLYLYEIINVPEIPPKYGAELIARVWGAYRTEYSYLDKYAGEWLLDYCLIQNVPIPYDVVSPFVGAAAQNLSMPELYCRKDDMSAMLVACSRYDMKKSKYYADNADFFETHITKAATAGIAEYMRSEKYTGAEPVHVSRDSFSGAVASSGAKRKLEIWYRAAPRGRGSSDAVSGIFKLCENGVRAALGIRSRLKETELPEAVVSAVNGYFDSLFPDRDKKRKKADDEEEYMKLYEPENDGTADISHALDIERDAWKTAAELEDAGAQFVGDAAKNEYADVLDDIEHDGDIHSMISALPRALINVIAAALDGDMARGCAETAIPVAEAERRINDKAYDAFGDALIENGNIIEDYRSDVRAALEYMTLKEKK